MQLSEQQRPASWEQIIGQDKIVGRIRQLAARGLAGKAFWISGPSGTGKTTIARLLAADVADEFSTEEIDATTLTTAALKDIERGMQIKGWGKGGRAYLVNEAHGLRKDCIRQLLVMLERIPPHVVVIFTTTCAGQASLFEDYDDSTPLLSRCIRFELSSDVDQLAAAWAPIGQRVAQEMGLDGQPVSAYQQLAVSHKGNLRACWAAIEAGEMLDNSAAQQREQERLAAYLEELRDKKARKGKR